MQIFPLDFGLDEQGMRREMASRTKDPTSSLDRYRSARRLGVDKPSWRLERREGSEGRGTLFLRIVTVDRKLTNSKGLAGKKEGKRSSFEAPPPFFLSLTTHPHPIRISTTQLFTPMASLWNKVQASKL